MAPASLMPGKRIVETLGNEAEFDADEGGSSSEEVEEEYQTEGDEDTDEQHSETNGTLGPTSIVKPTMSGSTAENGIELNSDSESTASVSSEEEASVQLVSQRPPPPLLPQHLLQPLPSPASPNTDNVAAFKALPWDQLTRGQKANARRRRREAGKKLYARIKADTDGTAVVPAGRFAQARRGVYVSRGTASTGGRVEKRKIETSGRQRLIAERSREVKATAQGRPLEKKRQKT